MNEVLLKFKIVKTNISFEVLLDNRLSFIDNFKLLRNVLDYDLEKYKVYEPNKKIFLDRNIPISQFNINKFISLLLF